MQQEGREVSGAGGAGVRHVLDVLAEVPVAVPWCVGIHKTARDLAPIWLGDGARRCHRRRNGSHSFSQIGAVYQGDIVEVVGLPLQGKLRDGRRILSADASPTIRVGLGAAIPGSATGPVGSAAGARENPAAPPYC